MARQLRVEYAGAIYHVTVRSNGEAELFLDDTDRKYLLSRLRDATAFHCVRVYLFCLMANHIHLVVETPKGNLSRFMQGVLTGYGVYFNRAHGRHGHVTQGRYGARLVEGDRYLLNLSRYVHLNPVKVPEMRNRPLEMRIAFLRAYPWSSYPAYIGEGARNTFVEYGPMLALVEAGRGPAERRYRDFIEGAIAEDDEPFLAELHKSRLCLGSDKFREWVDSCYQELLADHRKPEDVSLRREGRERVPVEQILQAVARAAKVDRRTLVTRQRDSRWRAVTAKLLCTAGGLTQREAAAVLGLKTGVAVSCQLKLLSRLTTEDAVFRKTVERLSRQLAKAGR